MSAHHPFADEQQTMSTAFEELRRIGASIDVEDDTLKILGVSMSGPRVTVLHVASLKNCPFLEYLYVTDARIDNDCLLHLGELPNLHTLALKNTPISDKGVSHLTRLPKLATLRLSDTQITDVALISLAKIKTLQRLSLDGTAVTARGLKALVNHASLGADDASLDLRNTRVTDREKFQFFVRLAATRRRKP